MFKPIDKKMITILRYFFALMALWDIHILLQSLANRLTLIKMTVIHNMLMPIHIFNKAGELGWPFLA